LGQADQAVLGRPVGRLQHRGFVRVHRAHVDDGAAAARGVHVRQAGLGRQEGAVEVDGEHLLPLCEGELLERVDDLDAGVADQDVDAAPGLHDRRDGGVDLAFVGDVGGDGHGAGAAGLQLVGGGLRGGHVHVGDGDLGAFACVGGGDLLADAAGGAGDDGDLVVQLFAHGDGVLGGV